MLCSSCSAYSPSFLYIVHKTVLGIGITIEKEKIVASLIWWDWMGHPLNDGVFLQRALAPPTGMTSRYHRPAEW